MTTPVFSYADDAMPPVKRGLIRMVEAATGQRRLRRLYMAHRREACADEEFWAEAVRRLQLDVRYDPEALAAIPRAGPCVVVANHPYGVLDGVVISWLVQKVRPDFLVLVHAALLKAPEARGFLLPVDFSGTPEAIQTNIRSRAIARRHLDAGGCIVVFPAGGISTAPDRLGRHRAVDAPWQPFTAQLIQRSRAIVVPVCFEGQNSRLFQIASHMSASLRLALIFHEVASRIGSIMRVAIGAPIAFGELAAYADRETMAAELKARTYALAATFPSGDQPGQKAKRLKHLRPRKPRFPPFGSHPRPR